MIGTWNASGAENKLGEELLASFDEARAIRVLVIPALFEEANKLRRFTIETMRSLNEAGIDSFLPDLPGMNESLAPLETQTIRSWREAATAAAGLCRATHLLSIRAGALIAPPNHSGWRYAPQTGAKVLRSMIRARTISAREAGLDETADQLMAVGRIEGLTLGGWAIGPNMFRELEDHESNETGAYKDIPQSDLGGAGLWLRAEPDADSVQSQTLAAIIADAARSSSGSST